MSTAGPEPVSFELDRFELVDDDRLVVSGRWHGARGRRFVRPSLTVAGAEGRSRALALLDHKPWAANDGDPWIAAFPWNPRDTDLDAELAVAPDIAIALPGPVPNGARPSAAPPSGQSAAASACRSWNPTTTPCRRARTVTLRAGRRRMPSRDATLRSPSATGRAGGRAKPRRAGCGAGQEQRHRARAGEGRGRARAGACGTRRRGHGARGIQRSAPAPRAGARRGRR